MNKVSILITSILTYAYLTAPTYAGGLLGDAINLVAPGAGTSLDDAHRQLKENIEPYKQLEEGASNTVREPLVQASAPILQEMIARSRDDAISAGVEPIPLNIRKNLQGFIPDSILNMAKFRVQGGGDLSLQVNSIRYGDAQAITLDYVIVFKDTNDALYNPSLWAHELTHVIQYQNWGIRDFAIKYLRNSNSVEEDAYDAQTKYAAWVGSKNAGQWANSPDTSPTVIDRPLVPMPGMQPSSTCGTPITSCQVNGSAPVGTSCWCDTNIGRAFGSLIPSNGGNFQPASMPIPAPAVLPPGTLMKPCGCWGPNPTMVAPEPMCSNGRVQLNICNGLCAPNQASYAYSCM
ncbi:DUF4157 domain-containing protein [Pseudomonas sp. B21-009]|uniref:DUF4157 domain-containing protein n=1 Tax=Pseudomonas sp. B21-009 TaxID=2895470 RepID=UPI00215EC271|nr:DUF4157 domain-containing protein [Pseudomonas sp. B21-009]UVM64411.1 DUF4157 domain-containing protein [Pseudomonas sp. B21-009]